MGSWANSLHVRADSAAAVADAVRAVLLESGHRVHAGQAAPAAAGRILPFRPGGPVLADDQDEEDWDGGHLPDSSGTVRSVRVFEPCQGWVGVLDSESFSPLAQQLSARLGTDTVSVLVNDSDAWYYELHRRGRSADEFDSSGEGDGEGDGDDGEMSAELQEAIARGDEAVVEQLMERTLLARAPSSPIYFPFGGMAPPIELSILGQRIAEGRASFRDRLRHAWLWLRFRFQVVAGWLGWRPMEVGFEMPRVTPLDRDSLDRHVARLKEVFLDADARALKRLLPLNRFPAEELLADFFGIVGLPRLYAYLSYSYLEEHSEDELAEEGIVSAFDLHFLTPS